MSDTVLQELETTPVPKSANYIKVKEKLDKIEKMRFIIQDSYINEHPVIPGSEAFRLNEDLPSDTAVILVHGFTGTPRCMAPLALKLSSLPAIISAIRLPGHGTSDKDLVDFGPGDWLFALEKEIEYMVKQGVEHLFLVGWSLGANICLRKAIDYPDLISGIVTLGSPAKFNTPSLLLLRGLSKFKFTIKRGCLKKHFGDIDVYESEITQQIINKYSYFAIKSLYRIVSFVLENNEFYDHIDQPLLLIHNKNDQVNDVSNSLFIFQSVNSKDKRLIVPEHNGGHAMTIDIGHEEMEEEVYQFFTRLIPN